MAEMSFAEHNNMVKTIPSDRTDEPLRISILPWRLRWDRPISYAHYAKPFEDDIAIDAISIANDVPWRLLPTVSLGQLTGDPIGTRACGHTQPQKLAAAETDGLAQRLATGPAMVYAATKELLRIWQSEGVRGARKALYDISMPLFGTDDTQRALHNVAAAVNAGQPIPRATFNAGPKDRPWSSSWRDPGAKQLDFAAN
jgi:hypothetical protein